MRYIVRLVVLLIALGWWAAEIPLGGEAGEPSHGPQWRRTSEGWIKVGSFGAAALDRPRPDRVRDPSLHPGVLAAFMLIAGILPLVAFDGRNLSGRKRFAAKALRR